MKLYLYRDFATRGFTFSGRKILWTIIGFDKFNFLHHAQFPPERRYNMNQVPLPFVNGQDDTFTMEDDNDVNIKCPKESLRK